MISFAMNMHGGERGYVSAGDIFSVFPSNLYRWTLLDFQGIGTAPGGLRMADFEQIVSRSVSGFPFAWDELVSFVSSLEEVSDMLVVVADDRESVIDEVVRGDYTHCSVVVDAFDSATWSVHLADGVFDSEFDGIVSKFRDMTR